MKSGFTKFESLWVAATLLVIITATYFNLQVSLRRARDAQRKNDIRRVADAVILFRQDYAFYPPASASGEVVACGEGEMVDKEIVFEDCKWGLSEFNPYLGKVPVDPKSTEGISYYYDSNGDEFQIFMHLEGLDEAEYDSSVEALGVMCGNRVCNWAIASDYTSTHERLKSK